MADLEYARHLMLDRQIERRGVRNRAVLEAMRRVPRERFVPAGMEEFAYDDAPLPIGEGQTISQPFIVAYMIQAAELEASDTVLEVGAGSGYAAAVMAQIASEVHAIERRPALAAEAQARFDALGYRNIRLHVGDGTRGWAEAAPYDAIIVSAGGATVPQALKDQLDTGGRLIIPVGRGREDQRLLRITRHGADAFEEEDLGGVRFVPLIGEAGWPETGEEAREIEPLARMVAQAAEPLPQPEDPAFGALFDRFGDRKVVLLGEASHGTSEFYRARAAITRRLIEEHGFAIVAVEADWPDAAAIDRHVRHRPHRADAEAPFQRFPTWMWRNTDVAAFVNWLRGWNGTIREDDRRAGFYGLDIYNMNASISSILAYLDRVDPEAAAVARERYGCLTPWQREPSTYGRAMLTAGYRGCEEAVVAQCRALLANRVEYAAEDNDSFLDAAQNARLVAAAEQYYRIMYYGGAESWNLRDRHMFETLEHVLEARGPDARAVVWAHNSHIGDARQTEMGRFRDEVNIGQLCRERFGDAAALIGMMTHSGTVAAATDWDGEMEVKSVRPSREGSFERLFHDAGTGRFLLDFAGREPLAQRLAETRLERFIGVIYRPETERASHYADASLGRQFDAVVWFDETTAVTPLGTHSEPETLPDTYPFGL